MNKNIIWSDIITSSKHIKQRGYNIKNKILYVKFHNNDTYEYTGVPMEIVVAFLQASSHGKFFWQNIRDYYHSRLV